MPSRAAPTGTSRTCSASPTRRPGPGASTTWSAPSSWGPTTTSWPSPPRPRTTSSVRRYGDAEALARRATERNPRLAAARLSLGLAQAAQGRTEKAVAAFDRVAERAVATTERNEREELFATAHTTLEQLVRQEPGRADLVRRLHDRLAVAETTAEAGRPLRQLAPGDRHRRPLAVGRRPVPDRGLPVPGAPRGRHAHLGRLHPPGPRKPAGGSGRGSDGSSRSPPPRPRAETRRSSPGANARPPAPTVPTCTWRGSTRRRPRRTGRRHRSPCEPTTILWTACGCAVRSAGRCWPGGRACWTCGRPAPPSA